MNWIFISRVTAPAHSAVLILYVIMCVLCTYVHIVLGACTRVAFSSLKWNVFFDCKESQLYFPLLCVLVSPHSTLPHSWLTRRMAVPWKMTWLQKQFLLSVTATTLMIFLPFICGGRVRVRSLLVCCGSSCSGSTPWSLMPESVSLVSNRETSWREARNGQGTGSLLSVSTHTQYKWQACKNSFPVFALSIPSIVHVCLMSFCCLCTSVTISTYVCTMCHLTWVVCLGRSLHEQIRPCQSSC